MRGRIPSAQREARACLEAQEGKYKPDIWKRKKNHVPNKLDIWKKRKTMSLGLISHHAGLLLHEEKGQCGIAKYRAECLNIGDHSPKRRRTRGGLSMRRHSKRQWKLEQNSDYWGDYGRDGCECLPV